MYSYPRSYVAFLQNITKEQKEVEIAIILFKFVYKVVNLFIVNIVNSSWRQ